MHKSYLAENLEALPQVALQINSALKHSLVLLIGDLGAGKTTLTKELIALSGCEDEGSSPSYSIINEYKLKSGGKLYHIDLYRLNSVTEVFSLGIEDIIYSGDLCFIEWPQIVYDYLEEPYHIIKIEVNSDNTRTINLV